MGLPDEEISLALLPAHTHHTPGAVTLPDFRWPTETDQGDAVSLLHLPCDLTAPPDEDLRRRDNGERKYQIQAALEIVTFKSPGVLTLGCCFIKKKPHTEPSHSPLFLCSCSFCFTLPVCCYFVKSGSRVLLQLFIYFVADVFFSFFTAMKNRGPM